MDERLEKGLGIGPEMRTDTASLRRCAEGVLDTYRPRLVDGAAIWLASHSSGDKKKFRTLFEAVATKAHDRLSAQFFGDLPQGQHINPLDTETDTEASRKRIFKETFDNLVNIATKYGQIRPLNDTEIQELNISGGNSEYLEERLAGNGGLFYRFEKVEDRIVIGVRTSEEEVSAMDITNLYETHPEELTELLGGYIATRNKKTILEYIERTQHLHDDELARKTPAFVEELMNMSPQDSATGTRNLGELNDSLRCLGLGSRNITMPSDDVNRASPEARLVHNPDFRDRLIHLGNCQSIAEDQRDMYRTVRNLWEKVTRLPHGNPDRSSYSISSVDKRILERASWFAPHQRRDTLKRYDENLTSAKKRHETDKRLASFYEGVMKSQDQHPGQMDAATLIGRMRENDLGQSADDLEQFTKWLQNVGIDFENVLNATAHNALFLNIGEGDVIKAIQHTLEVQFDRLKPIGKKPTSQWLHFDPHSPTARFYSDSVADHAFFLTLERMRSLRPQYVSKVIDIDMVRTGFHTHMKQRVAESGKRITDTQNIRDDFIRRGRMFDIFCTDHNIDPGLLEELEQITSPYDDIVQGPMLKDRPFNVLFASLLTSGSITNELLTSYLQFFYPEIPSNALASFAGLRNEYAGKVRHLEKEYEYVPKKYTDHIQYQDLLLSGKAFPIHQYLKSALENEPDSDPASLADELAGVFYEHYHQLAQSDRNTAETELMLVTGIMEKIDHIPFIDRKMNLYHLTLPHSFSARFLFQLADKMWLEDRGGIDTRHRAFQVLLQANDEIKFVEGTTTNGVIPQFAVTKPDIISKKISLKDVEQQIESYRDLNDLYLHILAMYFTGHGGKIKNNYTILGENLKYFTSLIHNSFQKGGLPLSIEQMSLEELKSGTVGPTRVVAPINVRLTNLNRPGIVGIKLDDGTYKEFIVSAARFDYAPYEDVDGDTPIKLFMADNSMNFFLRVKLHFNKDAESNLY